MKLVAFLAAVGFFALFGLVIWGIATLFNFLLAHLSWN